MVVAEEEDTVVVVVMRIAVAAEEEGVTTIATKYRSHATASNYVYRLHNENYMAAKLQ